MHGLWRKMLQRTLPNFSFLMNLNFLFALYVNFDWYLCDKSLRRKICLCKGACLCIVSLTGTFGALQPIVAEKLWHLLKEVFLNLKFSHWKKIHSMCCRDIVEHCCRCMMKWGLLSEPWIWNMKIWKLSFLFYPPLASD